MAEIQLDKQLIDLADSLIPNQIKVNSPQFYNLLVAFMANVQDVQDSINQNFLNTIDVSKINNNEIIRIYLDTYLAQMNLTDVPNPEALVDMLRVSKDLTQKKGTILIYNILLKLLVYLIPSIGTAYSEIINQLKTETDPEAILDLEATLEQLRNDNNDEGFLEYFNFNRDSGLKQTFDPLSDQNENIIPFRYRLESDLEEEIFERYFKPFCHPIGWSLEFVTVINRTVSDSLSLGFTFNIFDCIVLPKTQANDGIRANTEYDSEVKYPLNKLNDFILATDTDENYAEILTKVVNIDNVIRDGTNITYLHENFNTELPYLNDGVIDTTVDRQQNIGSFNDLDRLNYYIRQPSTGSMTTGNSIYRANNDIAGGNGGLFSNLNSNTVMYRKYIDNRRS